ncbi:MAG: prepilin peptidase [Candidatus Nanohaloarchaea archaeon]
MYLILSHALAFASLFVASLFDLDTTDVPDLFSAIGIAGGILIHGYHSWLINSWEPLMWSLGVGAVFSAYGWFAYYQGMWGGADALAIGVLGFAAPYTGNPSVFDPVNLFVNVMLIGFLHTFAYSVYRSWGSNVLELTRERIGDEKKRMVLEAGLTTGFILMLARSGLNWIPYAAIFYSFIVLYRFFKVVQNDLMYETVPVEELEGGEVAAPGQGFGDRIVGLEQEDIEEYDGDEIDIRMGVPFMPVFPAALLVTDLFGAGMFLIYSLL